VVSVAYYALVRPDQHPATGDSDASEAAWHPVDQLPPLAFDHTQILAKALERLRGKIRYQPVGFELLPKHFTLISSSTAQSRSRSGILRLRHCKSASSVSCAGRRSRPQKNIVQ
jgi:hypothetical protein